MNVMIIFIHSEEKEVINLDHHEFDNAIMEDLIHHSRQRRRGYEGTHLHHEILKLTVIFIEGRFMYIIFTNAYLIKSSLDF